MDQVGPPHGLLVPVVQSWVLVASNATRYRACIVNASLTTIMQAGPHFPGNWEFLKYRLKEATRLSRPVHRRSRRQRSGALPSVSRARSDGSGFLMAQVEMSPTAGSKWHRLKITI